MARSMPRRENWPALVNTIDVTSLDETVAALMANGGKLLEGPMTIPGVGAWRIARIPKATCSA